MSLTFVTKPFVATVCGGSFMKKPFPQIMVLMDNVSNNNNPGTLDMQG